MKKRRPVKIVFVGGGSVAWAPRLICDILSKECLRDAELVLCDTNRAAAERVREYAGHLQPKLGSNALVWVADGQDEAFAEATHYLIAISTGGLDSMAHDLSIPEDYGIYHTVGDTSGPGGWARFLRNFPVFEAMGRAIERHSPGAMVLNYTNPMTTLTKVLSKTCGGPVVGLCHALFENLNFLAQLYPDEAREGISVRYGGINHFFWITAARGPRIDILADLKRRVQGHSLSDLGTPPATGSSGREVATALLRTMGAMPYIADRHTSEFFGDYITDLGALSRHRIVRTSIADRRGIFARKSAELSKMANGEIPENYLGKSKETAADILEANVANSSFIDVGNLPNAGQISNLPAGLVVETEMRVDRLGFTPLLFGPLPQAALSWVKPHAEAFARVVDAAFAGDREEALAALGGDPVCARLEPKRKRELGLRLLAAHRDYTDYLR